MWIGLQRISWSAAILTALTGFALGAQTSSAEAYMERGDYRHAVEALDAQIRKDPAGDPEVYLMLAISLLNLDDKNGALEAAERGISQFPKSERLSSYYVSLVPAVVDSEEAEKRVGRALARNADSAVLKKSLGKALLARKAEDARTEGLLASAATAMPRDAEALYLYGKWACLHQKETLCASELAKSLAVTPPDNYAALVLVNGLLAVAQDRLGDANAADAAFAHAVSGYEKLDSPVPDVPYQYVKFLVNRGDVKKARQVNEEILKRNPSFAAAHLEQAKFLFHERHERAAIEESQLALKFAGDAAEARAVHIFLVKAYGAAGLASEARVHQGWVDANP